MSEHKRNFSKARGRISVHHLAGALLASALSSSCAQAQLAPPNAPLAAPANANLAETMRIPLSPAMLQSESDKVDFSGLVDEQDAIGDPPKIAAKNGWKMLPGGRAPAAAVADLGAEKPLASVWLFDTNGVGDTVFYAGTPGAWKPIATYDGGKYLSWSQIPLNVRTRYLRVEVKDGQSNSGEMALYGYSDAGWTNYLTQKAVAERAATEKAAAIEKARAEVANRPIVSMAPFGKLALVDEVDLGAAEPGHGFAQSPANVSRVETLLGQKARVLAPTEGESAYITVRMGQYKLLKPGGQYVLSVEYPEDAARSMVVRNGGNETSRGFYTGRALGDALHPKYVNNLNESLNLPLSGHYQTWTQYFSLHDRFPELSVPRDGGPRALLPEDGFPVTIAQFSRDNDPASQGAAVAKIRLYEVLEPQTLQAQYGLPAGLPQRHLFWREEMADGVIQSNKVEERGLNNRLDWYRDKARLMHFLGMNTYAKDLLEFGAVQHWDTSAGGGNDWAYFNGNTKDLWGQIVEMMGREGFTVLPYYEYSGSKGTHGLGNERRAKPLARDDAYTHIGWIEASNADLTDPDSYADFKKMLDLTVVRQKGKAKFAGIWLRSRGQMPMGFGQPTLDRFATEANGGAKITRQNLIADKALLTKYQTWWFGKRRQFLDAMRAYLVENGVENPMVLFTAITSEPGVPFADFDSRFITDDPAFWTPILNSPEQKGAKPDAKAPLILTPGQVADQGLYEKALLAPPQTWGGWEWNYGNPPSDPQNYKNDAGVLMTHGFNRAYTVASPQTFAEFRGPSRLAAIRFYSLNENMAFDKNDKEKLGYFVADMEAAGPYCMLAEARAVANGDPTEFGYLSGNNFERGFPQYARAFNTAFLSLPALPSVVVAGASTDKEIVVRQITTPKNGTFYAVVNTGLAAKTAAKIKLPTGGAVLDAATKKPLGNGNTITVNLGPCELQAWWVQ